jgi:hypothetical protein
MGYNNIIQQLEFCSNTQNWRSAKETIWTEMRYSTND